LHSVVFGVRSRIDQTCEPLWSASRHGCAARLRRRRGVSL